MSAKLVHGDSEGEENGFIASFLAITSGTKRQKILPTIQPTLLFLS
jgi:hypothetical protein